MFSRSPEERAPTRNVDTKRSADAQATRRACLGWAAAALVAPLAARAQCPCAAVIADDSTAQPASDGSPAAGVLRVCADPKNLPFSNRAREGFEDKIAHLLATDLGLKLEYHWLPHRAAAHRQQVVLRWRAGADLPVDC